jgi:hypothetical protein
MRRERVRGVEKEADQTRKMAFAMFRARQQSERDATLEARREGRKRVQDAIGFARQEATAMRRERERAEADIRRADARRSSSWSATGGRMGQAAFGAATSYASGLHGQIQGAREHRALTSRSISNAIYQAGAGGADAPQLQEMVYQFARDNRMSSAELAEGVNRAQTEFNVLGNSRSTQGERVANMRSSLETMRFARNTGQDTGEVLRVSGMLQNSGITDPMQRRQTLLAMTGMAQRGAIELGSVTSTAMAPIQQRIAQSQAALRRTNPNASDADRAHATQQAVLQTFAEMEVGRSMGQSPRMMGNIMAQMGNSLQSDVTQQKMLQNLRSSNGGAGNAAAEAALFARDANGRSHLRSTDALGLSRNLQTAFHGDSTAMQNVFAGGGHGNPQALQANWRRTLGLLMGGEGNSAIGRMISGAGSDFTERDVQRGEGLFANDEMSKLTQAQERNETALTDATNALVRFSSALADWEKAHPFSAPAAQAGGGLLGNALSGLGGAAAGRVLANGVGAIGAAGRVAAATGAAAPGVIGALGAPVGALGAGTIAAGVGGALAGGVIAGEGLNRAVNSFSRNTLGNRQSTVRDDSLFNPASWHVVGEALAASFQDAFRRNPPQITMPPAQIAHVRALAATANPGGR